MFLILTWAKNANQVLSMRVVIYEVSQNEVRLTITNSTLKLNFVARKNVGIVVCEVLRHFDSSNDSLVLATGPSGWKSRLKVLDWTNHEL